jgi:hypothetical protein
MIKLKNLFNLNEYKNLKSIHLHDNSLVEMARINDKSEFPYDVFVYGGDSYGSGRNEHGEPHFHFSDNIKSKNSKFKLSVIIPDFNEWKNNKELIISETNKNDLSWNGLKKEKINLINWLDDSNIDLPTITNLQMIITQWNILNKDNKMLRKFQEISKKKPTKLVSFFVFFYNFFH